MSESISVLMTGGNRGFGKQLAMHLNARAYSRTSGFDISSPETRKTIAAESLSSSIFINFVHAGDFSQTELLFETFALWKEKNHAGMIVNFGSYSTHSPRETWRPFSVYKTALRAASHQCSKETETLPLPFRVILLTAGMLDGGQLRAGDSGLKAQTVGELILQFHRTENCHFPEVVLSPDPSASNSRHSG